MRAKKGEVVGPAGGDTGGPHCLAEVYKPLRVSILHLKEQKKRIMCLENPVKQKIKEPG
jgi:hypothetical protein